MNPSLLPASARDLADLIGLPMALRLVEACGGQVLAIAHGKRHKGRLRQQELAAVVGDAAAAKIVRRYGGAYLSIPKCMTALRHARDARLQARFDELTGGGLSARAAVSVLVREYDLVDSSVWRVLKRPSPADGAPDDSRQRALFVTE